MSIVIKPSIIKLDTISAITMANELITKCVNDEIITIEEINTVLEALLDNSQKLLDVALAAFKHTIRGNNIELADAIIVKLSNLSDSFLLLTDIERAIKIISKFDKYINDGSISSNDKERLNKSLGLLQIKVISKKNDILPRNIGDPFEVSDSNLRLGALVNSVMELMTECQESYIQTESVKTSLRKGADKVKNTIVKYSIAEKDMSNRLNEKFNRFLSNYKADRKGVSYDKIVKDSVDLSRMLKNLIGSSIVALLIPGGVPVKLVAGALTLLVQFAVNKRTDNKYRGVVINDLKFEQRVVQEKIKDAESKGDNKAKYQLMRVENQISRAIDRVNYHLTSEQH